MTGAEPSTHRSGLSRRAWTKVAGILPITAAVTLILGCVIAGTTNGPVAAVLIPLLVVAGIAVGLLWRAKRGVEAVHNRVARVRADWASTLPNVTVLPDGDADQGDVALALPRGWRVVIARGRILLRVGELSVRAETWVLRAVGGSTRSPTRREVVAAPAPTVKGRLCVQLGVGPDPILVTPAWNYGRDESEPEWMAAVRDRVAEHDDVLATLSIGDSRVILFALDDPRLETTIRRTQLVCDVVRLIPV